MTLPTSSGTVYLIGAGPGDPDLLTVRALRLLRQVDVVVYDRLVSPEILDLAKPEAERIYVGKIAGNHYLSQDEINTLLVRLAREGRSVARLKGGDPLIFGRGGEEALFLAQHGVTFEIVPGITAAVGCTAYAGIPLTHRQMATSVTFVTGHGSGEPLDVDWKTLVSPRQTVVFYMGVLNLPSIVKKLIAHGRSPETPAAAIFWGTTARQRVVAAPLRDLPDRVVEEGIKPPALIVVGEVVRLRECLQWFGVDACFEVCEKKG